MLNADAIEKIQELSQSEIVKHNEVLFHQTSAEAKPLRFPTRQSAKVFSLTQVVSYLHNLAQSDEILIVNVADHLNVEVWEDTLNENEEISVAAKASFVSMFETFPFGKQMPQEEFVINLLTKFERTEALEEMLRFVSSVRAEKVSISEDDGYSQVAATKAGVHLTATAPVKNMWDLKTFKTFPEVEQPTIPYILRLHQREDESPKFALYECDGGKWKVNLTIAIRDWLKTRIKLELGELADSVTVL